MVKNRSLWNSYHGYVLPSQATKWNIFGPQITVAMATALGFRGASGPKNPCENVKIGQIGSIILTDTLYISSLFLISYGNINLRQVFHVYQKIITKSVLFRIYDHIWYVDLFWKKGQKGGLRWYSKSQKPTFQC